jgi:hypothetical protein
MYDGTVVPTKGRCPLSVCDEDRVVPSTRSTLNALSE